MKNKDYLTVRQEELMNFLWKVNEPLTANEMAERLAEDGWNNVTLFKTVQSLTTDGYLEVVGLEKTVKTYARKLAPSMSKDDYYASVLIKRGIDSSSIANITAALIGAKDKQAKEKNAEVIAKLEEIKQANVIIAVAGMEGALPGVLAGLVEVPVIAVPTSVGYGANFGGLSALLTMLNSCANGISVVNIDNGFGAGYLAGQINKLATGELVR